MRPIASDAAPAITVDNADAAIGEVYTQLESFVHGVLALDPQEAALRAGLSFLVVGGAIIVLVLLRLSLKALAARLGSNGQQDGETPAAPAKIGAWTLPIARFAVAAGAVLLLLQIWGVGISEVLAGPLGSLLLAIGRIALTIAIVFAAIEVAQLAITRLFARVAKRAREPRRAAQLRTIAPVVSGLSTTTLLAIGAMMVLGQVGVEIGPLIAGAGIVGLAVGFGAQTLVKDFLTGLFLIVEDTVSVGDVARIGESSGVVEDMSLRTIKLRDFNGTLHVIPYGEAQIIHNMTKGFAFYVFDLSVSYSSDIVHALELIRDTGKALQNDAEFGPMMLEPIEVFGVDKLADSGVVLKARIRTRPGKQWSVGREYLKRIKLAFDAGGIEIPFPHLKLVPPDQPVSVGEVDQPHAAE